jgi:hypothetical protein
MNTDGWTERWPEHPVIRTFDPPRPVQVDIGKALPLGRGGAARADYVSMRVKSSAVCLSGLLPALQTHWFQIFDGQWLAAITVYVTDAAGSNSLELDMIVTADAISEPPSP